MVWLPHWPRVGEVVIKEGLTRISKMLDALGNPERVMPPVIHFAGTNGKGSTISFVQAILESAGLKVHIYTSPHLLRYNERIRLCGQEIDDRNLESLLEECRIISETNKIDVSFFEGTTAAAFLAFSRTKADVVLLETGLGGRLDATNIVSNPLLSVITPISLDHMAILGNDVRKIAYEKACIIKSGIPCVVSMQTPEVHNVIEQYAEKQNSPLFRYEYDFGCKIKKGGFVYQSDCMELSLGIPSLSGYHQFINASTAIAAVSCLSGIKITHNNIMNGIRKASWKGRLQLIEHGSLVKAMPGDWQLWVDGAHNEGGACALSSWLKDQDRGYVNIMILGMTKNRDIKKFISYFKGDLDCIVGVPVYSEPMSYSASAIARAVKEIGVKAFENESVKESIQFLVKKYTKTKVRILITGSLFLVSDFFVANNG